MNFKPHIQSQYHASLAMLRNVVERFPESAWDSGNDQNKSWHIAYHAVFYAHFYLHPTADEYEPWPKHRQQAISLQPGEGEAPQPFSKSEVLEFLDYLGGQVDGLVDALNLEADSGFYWLPFNKMELQFYNIRHLTLHTGELAERLWAVAGEETRWVGKRPDHR